MKKNKRNKTPFERFRKPIPKPGSFFKDRSKYNRKKKHKKDNGEV
jgi:hypothetical protein